MLDEAENSKVLAGVKDQLASARTQAADMADHLKAQASQVANRLNDNIGSGGDAVRNKAVAAKDAAATGWATARHFAGDAALIGGLGLTIGAIVAAALPETRVEAKTMGQASDKIKRKAGEAVQFEFAAAKDAAISAVDAAAKSVGESDLRKQASRMTQNLSGTLKEAAADVVSAAFSPPRNPVN